MEKSSTRGFVDGGERRSDGELNSDQEAVETYEESRRREPFKKKPYRKERRRSSSSEGRRPRDGHRDRRRRHQRRDVSRSRSRSTSQTREKRKKYTRRNRSKSRSSTDSRGSYDSWGSCEYGGRFGDDRSEDSYKFQVPNNTVMVRGLAPEVTENDIRQDLLKCGILIKDIRLIRHRDSGASRGFAFVEFHTVAEAIRWMEQKKGILVLDDLCEANLIYSVTKGHMESSSNKSLTDWYCGKCRGYNFKRRDLCYKCNEPRPPEQDPEIISEMSHHPTSTIMLFNLDILTTEEGILQAFQCRPALALIPIRSVRVAREAGTNLSRGICYVETNNLADAIRLYGIFTRDVFEVDERKVQAAYHKSPSNVPKNTAAAAALAAAQWTNSSQTECKNVEDIEELAEYSAKLYAKTEEEHASYLEYYRNYYRNQTEKGRDKGYPANERAEVSSASSDKKRVELLAATGSQACVGRTDPLINEALQGVPGASRYQYDESSGYYYDPVSGFYYDAKTRYHYDAAKQQFMYWDPTTQKFNIVSGETCPGSGSENKPMDNENRMERTGKSRGIVKIKGSKNAAKDVEKWTKTIIQRQEVSTSNFIKSLQPTSEYGQWSRVGQSCSASCSSGPFTSVSSFVVQEPKEKLFPVSKDSPKTDGESSPSNLMINGSSPGPSGPEGVDLRFMDMNKIACLLCKRMFSCEEILMKHARMSELHKQNLAAALGQSSSDMNSISQGFSNSAYRDRAKERRLRFGTEQEVASNSLKDLYMKVKTDIATAYVEEPTKEGIRDDNIGNRMLQKMGWQEGQGLGKHNRGIIDPITADRRVAKLGLGNTGAEMLDVDESDDRQTKARKLTLARYRNLD